MAFGKKRNRYLKWIIFSCTILILFGSCLGLGYYYHQDEVNTITKSFNNQVEQLKIEAYMLKKSVYTCDSPLAAGTVLDTALLKEVSISTSVDQSQFVSKEDFGKVLALDLEANQPLMKAMVYKELIAADVREEEINTILLPSNLSKDNFIDVRISFPNGEDYIVLSKKKVRDIELSTSTFWLWLKEEEMLTFSSAIVDTYLHKGTKLYCVSYVAPSIQEDAIPNYPVNPFVIQVMLSNPNIVEEAKSNLNNEARAQLDLRLSLLTEENINNVESGVSLEVQQRKENIVNQEEQMHLAETDLAEAETPEDLEIVEPPIENEIPVEGEQDDGFY